MFQKIEIRDVHCIRNVEIDLQPFHAFIGPNDSGKSTILECVRSLCLRASGVNSDFLDRLKPGAWIRGTTSRGPWTVEKPRKIESSSLPPELKDEIGVAALVRFDPDALRRPSHLLPDSQHVRFLSERGAGLPGIYQAILSRGDDTFLRVTAEVRRLFPTIKNLRLPAISAEELVLEIELTDGQRVRADRMSDGILYYLGFVSIVHLQPVRVLLVEEPENGLHPARIREVVDVLRRVGTEHGSQILIATHSPLVVNEMKPEEVSIVTRPDLEKGTRVTPILATPNFQKRSSVYALGELWLSYADGVEEKPLLTRGDSE